MVKMLMADAPCISCDGYGFVLQDKKAIVCETCHGVRYLYTCPECCGSRRIGLMPCGTCACSGIVAFHQWEAYKRKTC